MEEVSDWIPCCPVSSGSSHSGHNDRQRLRRPCGSTGPPVLTVSRLKDQRLKTGAPVGFLSHVTLCRRRTARRLMELLTVTMKMVTMLMVIMAMVMDGACRTSDQLSGRVSFVVTVSLCVFCSMRVSACQCETPAVFK